MVTFLIIPSISERSANCAREPVGHFTHPLRSNLRSVTSESDGIIFGVSLDYPKKQSSSAKLFPRQCSVRSRKAYISLSDVFNALIRIIILIKPLARMNYQIDCFKKLLFARNVHQY